MKKEIRILGFVKCIIKKFFFIDRKNDIYQDCKEAMNAVVEDNEKEVDEYLKNYQATTRWQTV
ncbi:MAG: hypothetical protein JW761_15110 [Prolixibacteraceae bacterium]|nr:hypothetical protein [Prolixibacteraceae bacterium]